MFRYLDTLKSYYNRIYNENSKLKNKLVVTLQNKDSLSNQFIEIRNEHHNESLADLVLNANSVDKVIDMIEFFSFVDNFLRYSREFTVNDNDEDDDILNINDNSNNVFLQFIKIFSRV